MIALIIISGMGILAMLSEIFNFKKLLFPIVLVGIATAFVFNILEWNNPVSIAYFDNMIQFDKAALAFSSVILFVAFLWFMLAHNYFKQGSHLVDHMRLFCSCLLAQLCSLPSPT